MAFAMRRMLVLFLAFFRLDGRAVCEASRGCGLTDDYHDYPDDEFGRPLHFMVLECVRCGKRFTV